MLIAFALVDIIIGIIDMIDEIGHWDVLGEFGLGGELMEGLFGELID